MNQILVTSYNYPDLDGTSGGVAYAEYLQLTGRPAVAGFFGELFVETNFLLTRYGIPAPLMLKSALDYKEVVLVDASSMDGLVGLIDSGKVVEVIDHRQVNNAHLFVNAKTQIEMVGAAATLVAEKFFQLGLNPSKESAILLCGGIVSNTLNFLSPNTTDRDQAMYAKLSAVAGIDASFAGAMFQAKSDVSGEKLFIRLDGDLATFEFGSKKVGIAQLELMGARDLVEKRASEIVGDLVALKTRDALDIVFLNLIDLEEGKNYFLAADEVAKTLVSSALGVMFDGAVAVRDQLIMRKQIVPLIRSILLG